MEIITAIYDQIAILTPAGRIDSVTANEFDIKLVEFLDQNFKKIIINFATTDFISSAGLRILLIRAKQIKILSGKLALCGMSDSIEEVFEVSGFSTIFNIYQTSEAAIKALGGKI